MEINRDADQALGGRALRHAARDLAKRAKAILVLPSKVACFLVSG